MATGASFSGGSDIEIHDICYTTTPTGSQVLVGVKRHDDLLPPPGFAVFDSDGNQVDINADGYQEVPCTECCPTVIDSGCWTLGTESGRFVSMRDSAGNVETIDIATGDEVDENATLEDCPDCCPTTLGEGCWDDGTDIGRWVSIRNPDGTVGLTDVLTGDPVDSADNVPCSEDAVVVNSHARLLAAGEAWQPTPDLGSETALSISFTVLSGTATVVDSNGDIVGPLSAGVEIAWSTNNDQSSLTPPQSITAGANSSVLVVWTAKA